MGICIESVCVLVLGSLAIAQPTTWDGDAGDGFWVSQQNWDTDTVPSGSSEVMIPSDAGQVQIILSGESCASISCLSSLRLTSGTLNVSGTGTVTNMIFDGGGFIPTIITSGAFTISGNSTCITGDALGNGGEFENAGVFDAFSFGINGTNGFSGTNSGTWNMSTSSAALTLSNGALFDNQGTFTLQPFGVITGSSGLFSNSGTLSRTGGVGTTTIDTGLTQLSGTISASGPTAVISVLSDGWQLVAGTLEVSNGGKLSIAGSDQSRTRTLGVSAITGDGTVDLFPANVTIDWVNFTTTNVSGGGVVVHSGTVNLSGDLTNNGLFVGRGATMSGTGSFNNTAIGVLEVPTGNGFGFKMNATSSGIVDVRGSLILNDGAVFNQLFSNGVSKIKLYDQSSIDTSTQGTPGVLHSGGAIELQGDATGLVSSSISARLETQGGNLLAATNGTLSLNGGGSIRSSVIRIKGDLSAGALKFEGTLPWSVDGSTAIFRTGGVGPNSTEVSFGVINGAGPMMTVADGVEFSFQENLTANLLSSDFAGSGKLVNRGVMKWFGGTLGCDLNNFGVMEILPGIVGKTLSADILNSSIDGGVDQSSTFSVDGGSVLNLDDWTMSEGSSIFPAGVGGEMHNAGTLLANGPGGATHVIGVDLNNTGFVGAFGGHLVLTGEVLQLNQLDGTLSGGRWSAIPGSSITFPRSLVQLRGPGQIEGGDSEFPDLLSLESIDNAGVAKLLDTTFNSDLGLSGGSSLTAEGDVTVNGKYSSTGGSTTTIEPGAKIEATGGMEIGEVDSAADDLSPIVVIARKGVSSPSIVTPLLELWGGIRVGETGTSIVEVEGDVVVYPSGRVHVNVLGSGHGFNTSDRLNVDGVVTLGGTLMIDASLAEFVVGESLTVLSATGGIIGVFDDVQVFGLETNQTMVAWFTGNQVQLVATAFCSADLNDDGFTDFLDISAFLTGFGNQDAVSDLNGDGFWDFLDISVFLSSFAAGCP